MLALIARAEASQVDPDQALRAAARQLEQQARRVEAAAAGPAAGADAVATSV